MDMNEQIPAMTDSLVCRIDSPKPLLIIFGASGDLARRKLVPAIYRLFRQAASRVFVLGAARTEMTRSNTGNLCRMG
jgi:glucose-6-phosphate 1-dehydrogenase